MRKYSVLQALPLSFYSGGLYREVARTWQGAGLLYQLFLIAIATVVMTIHIQLATARFVTRYAEDLVAQIPPITITNGIVSVDAPTPLAIRDSTGKAIAIIDTTGQVTALTNTTAFLLLTRDKLVMVRSAAETRVYSLDRIKHFTVDRKRATRWVHLFANWIAIIGAPFVLVSVYVVRLIVMLICAGLTLLIGKAMRREIDYAAAMRLTAVALTPATLLEVGLDAATKKPPMWGFIWMLITAAYLLFAVRSGVEQREATPAE